MGCLQELKKLRLKVLVISVVFSPTPTLIGRPGAIIWCFALPARSPQYIPSHTIWKLLPLNKGSKKDQQDVTTRVYLAYLIIAVPTCWSRVASAISAFPAPTRLPKLSSTLSSHRGHFYMRLLSV